MYLMFLTVYAVFLTMLMTSLAHDANALGSITVEVEYAYSTLDRINILYAVPLFA